MYFVLPLCDILDKRMKDLLLHKMHNPPDIRKDACPYIRMTRTGYTISAVVRKTWRKVATCKK